MSDIDVSIILVNYFSEAHTLRCLDAIHEHTSEIRYEVFVVDNSGELNATALTSRYAWVKVLSPGRNLGFGSGNHFAAVEAKGKYFFFLNNDTQLFNNVCKLLFDFMESHPNAAIAGPQLVDPNELHTSSFGYLPTLTSKILGTGWMRFWSPAHFPVKNKVYTEPLKVDVISGATLFFRAEIYRAIGGFDPQFFLYCEEEDVSLGVHNLGYTLWFIPNAKVLHVGGGSSFNSLPLKKEFYISFFKFYRKHYGRLKFCILFLWCLNRFCSHSLFRKDKLVYRYLLKWLLRGAPSSESLRYAPGNIDGPSKTTLA